MFFFSKKFLKINQNVIDVYGFYRFFIRFRSKEEIER